MMKIDPRVPGAVEMADIKYRRGDADINSYSRHPGNNGFWPRSVDRDGHGYLERPWGFGFFLDNAGMRDEPRAWCRALGHRA